jgi:SAM-dependent methyltransferase
MPELDLLAKLPKSKRDLQERKTAKAFNAEAVAIARLFGWQYFDGPREYGYGGYRYDGRWMPVAEDIVKFYSLQSGSRVLDVGCAKGFLVSDLMDYEVDAFGLDISRYALKNCHPPVIGRLHLGEADLLPFPDNSFDVVLSINTLHNLPRDLLIEALKEINRVSKGNAFIQVDSYRTPEQKKLFEDWVLTAQFHGYPDDWLEVFTEADYRGDYGWTIIE